MTEVACLETSRPRVPELRLVPRARSRYPPDCGSTAHMMRHRTHLHARISTCLGLLLALLCARGAAYAKPPSEAERLSEEERAKARAAAAAEKASNRFNCWRDVRTANIKITCRAKDLPVGADWEATSFGNFSEAAGTQEKEIPGMPGDVILSLPEFCKYDRLPTFGPRCTAIVARPGQSVAKRTRAELKAEQKQSALLYDLERLAQGKRPICYDIKNVVHAEIVAPGTPGAPDFSKEFAFHLDIPENASCDALHGNRRPVRPEELLPSPSIEEIERQRLAERKKAELETLRRALLDDPLRAACRPCGDKGGLEARIESCQAEMEDLAQRKATVEGRTYTWSLVSCFAEEEGRTTTVWRDDEPDGGLWGDVIGRFKYDDAIQFKDEEQTRLDNLQRITRSRRGINASPGLVYAIHPSIAYSVCADDENEASLLSRGRLRTQGWSIPSQADVSNALRHGILKVLPNLANSEIWLGDPHYYYSDKAWRLAGAVGRILMTDRSDETPLVRCFAPMEKLELSTESDEERRRRMGWSK